MATNPEDEATSEALVDQEFIPSEINSQTTVTENEEDHIQALIEDTEDEGEKLQGVSKTSSFSSEKIAGVADKDGRRKKYGASKRSFSLISDKIVVVENEEERLQNNGASRRSGSLITETSLYVTKENDSKTFHQTLRSRASVKIEANKDEPDEDKKHIFHQVSNKSASIGKRIAEYLTAETPHQGVKRRVSIAEDFIVKHGSQVPPGKKIFENALDGTVKEATDIISKNKTFYDSVMHDPAMPQLSLEHKRTSFQTLAIEGLTVDDTKDDDDDDSEREKLLWKRMFERKVTKRVLRLQEQKAILHKKSKHEKLILEKKVPLDLLAEEWFNENNLTVQTRLYLLEKLLPTLILGLEKLLMEVEKNHLTLLETPHPYFNPINFLAQYLMRNNPRQYNFPDDNPYMRGLTQVVEQLNIHVVDIKDNRLSTLKAETKLRQKEREQQHKIHLDNQEERRKNLRLQFRDWMLSTNGNVTLCLAQSVLVSFSESFAEYHLQTFEDVKYNKDLEELDTTGQILNEEQFVEVRNRPLRLLNKIHLIILFSALYFQQLGFGQLLFNKLQLGTLELFPNILCPKAGPIYSVAFSTVSRERKQVPNPTPAGAGINLVLLAQQILQYMHSYVKGLSENLFQDFLTYLSHSSDFFNQKGQSDWWKQQFSDLFLACDTGKSGFLNRHRILLLFEQFYDQHSSIKGTEFRNPREWPVVELDEMVPADFILDFGNDYARAEAPRNMDAENEITADQVEEKDSEKAHMEEHKESKPRRLSHFTIDDGDPFSDENSYGNPDVQNTAAFKFPDLASIISDIESRGHALNSIPFDKSCLNNQQFIQLMETFVGNTTKFSAIDNLIDYIQKEYRESKEEKFYRLSQSYNIPPEGPITKYCRWPYFFFSIMCADSPMVHELDQAGGLSPGRLLITQDEKPALLEKFSLSGQLYCFGHSEILFGILIFTPPFGKGIAPPSAFGFGAVIQSNLETSAALHKLVLEALFEKWDNNVSGFLNLRELEEVLSTYKDGMEKDALKRAHHKLKFSRKYRADNPILSKAEFSTYIETIAAEISDNEPDFDCLVTFLTARREQNCTARLRRTARRRWLHDIQQAAETSSSNLEFVYKSVFQTLYKDSEAHGDNKEISSSIALLRHNDHRPERGEHFLHYVACTLEDAPYVLNQALYRDMGVSFSAIDEGKPLHILKVQEHGKVHIWNCHREKINGSFLVIPLKDQHNRVFGVMGVDTLRDRCERYFNTHEINFYQGVAKAFSIAYHHVQVRNNILKAVDNAVLWLFNQTQNIETVITYLAEPLSSKDYVLCKTMTTENDFDEGWSDVHVPPIILQRKDNFFRNYLFRCADTSEVVYTKTYKGRCICVPLRDVTGRALAVLEINLGKQKQLMAYEYTGLQRMLKILHEACNIIVKTATEIPRMWLLEDQKNGERRAKLQFHQVMLQELRESINDLSEESLQELKGSSNPPMMAHNVFRIVLHLLQPKLDVQNFTWDQCRDRLNNDLIEKICAFDPVDEIVKVDTYLLVRCFRATSKKRQRKTSKHLSPSPQTSAEIEEPCPAGIQIWRGARTLWVKKVHL
ncbi:EF-hand calcium-binding domain-containing protein 5-like [Carcharodon carcharias]|uniref:EF-hand calcium-binding domain-containing protein 5-like n=1 Tax=Carcharodon carcharias TaxID=13397 RepID=UPI001B7EF5D6|nr:EF-hand calcium-binding domain-containing protein 5-like [Carcharodon carcharias]